MNLDQAKATVVSHFPLRKTVIWAGASGIGKTDAARECSSILSSAYGKEVGLVYVLCPTLYGPDVMGQLYRYEDSDGQQRSGYTMPAIISAVRDTNLDMGILVLDEFMSAGHEEQKALAQLLIPPYHIGDYPMPKGWMTLGCTNRLSDNTGVNKPLPHVVNRTCWVNIEAQLGTSGPNGTGWLKWAETKGNVHYMGISFAKQFPEILFHNTTGTKDKKAELPQFCTPRKFTDACQWLVSVSPDKNKLLTTDWAVEVLAGHIGTAAAISFTAHIKNHGLIPSWEEIVADPASVAVPGSDRPDLQLCVTQMLSHRVTEETADAGFAYLMRLPREMQVSGILTCMEKVPAIMKNVRFQEWLDKNRNLILSSIT